MLQQTQLCHTSKSVWSKSQMQFSHVAWLHNWWWRHGVNNPQTKLQSAFSFGLLTQRSISNQLITPRPHLVLMALSYYKPSYSAFTCTRCMRRLRLVCLHRLWKWWSHSLPQGIVGWVHRDVRCFFFFESLRIFQLSMHKRMCQQIRLPVGSKY